MLTQFDKTRQIKPGRRRKGSVRLTAVLAAVLLSTAACAGTTDSDDTPANGGDGSKYGLPSGVTEVRIATNVGIPPYEFYEDGTEEIQGYEPDLLEEAASRLGVKMIWSTTGFDALFTGLDSDRYDMIANGLIDRVSRQAKYDVLDYIRDASNFIGHKGTTGKIASLDDVCGERIGLLVATAWEQYFRDQSDKCVADGESEISIVTLEEPTGVPLAVKTDRVDFGVNQAPSNAYIAGKDDDLEASEFTFLEGLVGLVFPKDSDLVEPFGKVLDEMIEDGTYGKILADWDLENLAVDKTSLNAATTE